MNAKNLTRTTRLRSLRTLVVGIGFTACAPWAMAQTPANQGAESFQVFHLKNVAQANEAISIANAVRNMLSPTNKVYLVAETNDLMIAGPPDQVAAAGRLVAELDRPKHTYRVTYTLVESDAGKRVGVQHFSMVLVTGQRIMLKQGDKIPVVTGSFSTEQKAQESQFTYLDVGVNLDTTLDQFADGLRVRSKVEQSSVAAQHQSGVLADEPIVRQSVLEGTSFVLPGKPLMLGGIDIAGSTRHIDIEIVAEPLS